MKRVSKLVVASFWIALACIDAHAQPAVWLASPIAPQPLAAALREFAAQTGLQLIYVSDVAATQESKGCSGGVSAQEALERLLEGSGVQFEFINDRTVRIFAGHAEAALSSSSATANMVVRAEKPEPA